MPFLGNQPSVGYSTIVKDDFTGNGSTTDFTLSKSVASANDIAVFVGNVRQEPTEAYTVNGTTLTMSAAPSSSDNFYVLHLASAITSSTVPATGTITSGMLTSGSVTSAKLDTNIDIAGNLTVDTNTLYVDATNNRVGIGTASPSTNLHVSRGSAGGGSWNGHTALAVESPNYAVISLKSPNANFSQILFADLAGTSNGQIAYMNSAQTNANSMQFYTNNAERMRIDSSGRVTMPYQPAFKQALSAGSLTQNNILKESNVALTTGRDEFNTGGHYNHTTGLFTAPVAGTYWFGISWMRNSNSAGQPALRYVKNGTSISMWARSYATGYYSNYQSELLVTITKLNANDYVGIICTDSGPVTFYGDDSYIMGYLIC